MATRVVYLLLFLVTAVTAWVMSNWAAEWLEWIPAIRECHNSGACAGSMAVYRLMSGMAVFHLLMSLLMINVKNSEDARAKFQDGWWIVKVPLWLAFVVVPFLIPNAPFEGFAWIALFGAGLFICIQLIYIVDFAHSWNESWVANYEESDSKKWLWGLFVCSLLMYLGSLAAVVVMYVFFSCVKINIFFITMDLVLAVVITVASLHPRVQAAGQKVGMLQSSLVFAYSTYFVWDAVISEPEHVLSCSSLPLGAVTSNVSVVLGAVFSLLCVCWIAVRVASSNAFSFNESGSPDDEDAIRDADADDEDDADDEREEVAYNYSFFHFVFMLACLYMAMVLTSWDLLSSSDDHVQWDVNSGWPATWVKMAASWTANVLYALTLFVPVIRAAREDDDL